MKSHDHQSLPPDFQKYPRYLVACLILCAFAAILFSGCSRSLPATPSAKPPDFAAIQSALPDSHHIWGEWSVSIDPGTLAISSVPVRDMSAHWNVTGLIAPAKCPGCLSWTNIHKIDPGTLSVTVRLTHPFPDAPSLDSFDVKGIVLAKPGRTFPSGTVSTLVANPDGYTSRWSYSPWAEINPFLDFAVNVPARRFAGGTSHEREFIVNIPPVGKIVFDYVIDACWLPPSIVDPENPSLSNHCNEAYNADINVAGNLNAIPGSIAEISANFHDWQNDGSNASVTIEIPSLMDDSINAIPDNSANPYRFSCGITNQKCAAPGIYTGLACIRDALNNPSNDALATFILFNVTVTNEIPSLTGISIEPDAISLSGTGSSSQLSVYADYTDGSKSLLTQNIDWHISGYDLNGNPLASIDTPGKITRISSKWWGGTATVSADYSGFHAESTVFCMDPFADSADVQFGKFCIEGEGFANPSELLGPPSGGGISGGSKDVCALGYGGVATLEFTNNIIVDGIGPDFIVFENAFYAGSCDYNGHPEYTSWNETAVVEVSQDGIAWHRFPCDYNPDNSTCGIEPYRNPSSFTGIAGNYPIRANVKPDGTLANGIDPTNPCTAGGDSFDLADVGLAWCSFVRLIDTGDSVDAPGTEIYDDNGDMIMDFGKISALGSVPGYAGFDCDSVAAVHYESPLIYK